MTVTATRLIVGTKSSQRRYRKTRLVCIMDGYGMTWI